MRKIMLYTAVTALAAAAAVASSTVATAASSSTRWSRVTPEGTSTIADVGLASGSHGVLNVFWASGRVGDYGISDTPVSAAGAADRATAVSSGYELVTDPDATVSGSRIDVIWNGIKTSTGPTGTFLASRAETGGRWSAPANVPPGTGISYTGSSDSATTGADGKPWFAFTATDQLTVDHFGHPERMIPPTSCCVYNPGLAVDAASKGTWIAYQSIISGHEGIFAQRLANTGAPSGKSQLLPGSRTHGATALVFQRVGVTARRKGQGGVYAAYATGYPDAVGVDLLRLGTDKPAHLATAGQGEAVAGTTVTADPAGGLWVAWFYGSGTKPALFVRQSNDSVRTFGKTQGVPLPSGTTNLYKVYICSAGSRLDLVALLTRHGKTAYWVTQLH
jgi:hypothetical protein